MIGDHHLARLCQCNYPGGRIDRVTERMVVFVVLNGSMVKTDTDAYPMTCAGGLKFEVCLNGGRAVGCIQGACKYGEQFVTDGLHYPALVPANLVAHPYERILDALVRNDITRCFIKTG